MSSLATKKIDQVDVNGTKQPLQIGRNSEITVGTDGSVVLPSSTTIGNVSSTELGYLDGVTSAVQTQINTKTTSGQLMYSDFYVNARCHIYKGMINATSGIAVLDGYYGHAYDGYWLVNFSGYSGMVQIFDTYGSVGTVQILYNYGVTPQMRNRTDDVAWSAWKTL